ERVAFGKIEFATDHIVSRARIATDLDPLHVSARTLIDGVCDRYGAIGEVAIATRRNLCERIAAARNPLGERDQRLLDLACIVDPSLPRGQGGAQRLRIDL